MESGGARRIRILEAIYVLLARHQRFLPMADPIMERLEKIRREGRS